MNYLFSISILLFTLNNSSFAQLTVKELDRLINKQTKHKLEKFKSGTKDELLGVYVYKIDKKIFSVMKREMFKSNKTIDSLVSYQFGYINDTLLRVWFSRLDRINKKNGVIIAYISGDTFIVIKKSGDINLPTMAQIREKSKQLTLLAEELINTIK